MRIHRNCPTYVNKNVSPSFCSLTIFSHVFAMHLARCNLILFFLFAGLSIPALAFSQDSELSSEDGTRMSEVYHLFQKTDDLNPLERARVISSWMDANDWLELDLDLDELYSFYDAISVDLIDRESFSVRWTGQIIVPQTGNYVFRQVQDYSNRGQSLHVTIGDQLVFGSSDDNPTEKNNVSEGILLNRGESFPIVVELKSDASVLRSELQSLGPMAMLCWSRDGNTESFIPTTCFKPPVLQKAKGDHGLIGQYYQTDSFKDIVLTRLDSTLDFDWSHSPIAPIYSKNAKKCLQKCKEVVLERSYLSHSSTAAERKEYEDLLWRVAQKMSGSERQKLVDVLYSQVSALGSISDQTVAKLYESIYMLPNDKHVSLIGEWAMLRPQPRSLPGEYSPRDGGNYYKLNHENYFRIGSTMQGYYWSHVQQMWDEYLILPNGECNLTVAYLTAYATRAESFQRNARHRQKYYELIDSRLRDDSLVGDTRFSWLLARNFMDEITKGKYPQPLPNSDYLNEAMLVAESQEYQDWIFKEVAIRLAAHGNVFELDSYLAKHQTRHSNKAVQKDLWRSIARAKQAADLSLRKHEEKKFTQLFASELRKRLEQAKQSGNDYSSQRYENLLMQENYN